MAVEVSWYLNFDSYTKDVTSPHPWVDPEGIAEYGNIIQARMHDIADKAAKLQAKGWTLKLDHGFVIARSNVCKNAAEAALVLNECGVALKQCTIVVRGE